MTDRPPAADAPRAWPAHFLPLLLPYRRTLAFAALAMVLDALLTALRPWPLKVVIDVVLSHKPTRVPFLGEWLNHPGRDPMHVLYGACAATLLIALSTGLLTYGFTRAVGDVAQRFAFQLKCRLFAHIQRLSLRFHDQQRIGDLMARLTADVSALQDVVANGSILLLSNACLLIFMLGLMFWLNWQFAVAALCVAPILFWTVLKYTRRIKVAARAARTSDGVLASVAQETFVAIRIVQGLAQEQQQDERFQLQGENSLRAYLEGVRYQARVAPLVDVLAAVGLVIVMWYGATKVLANELTTGDVIIFFAYVTNFYAPMKALARLSTSLSRALVALERIQDIFQERTEVRTQPGARALTRIVGRIEFRGVSFAYEPGQPVLSSIDLEIAPGEKVAIVGATGAGKSTLVGLIPRFFDPIEGQVLIDGEDIRDVDLLSLREQISLVLQDALLFSGTIGENIAFGLPTARQADIVAAARLANAEEFILRSSNGYETPVAERGATLSGGQKQRVAIARAILRDAPILILDEPTSGLDVASERIVIDALERAAEGRTTLIIAHRLATVRFADRILVLEHGRIVEAGSHAQLLARNGRYARLCELQVRAGSEAG